MAKQDRTAEYEQLPYVKAILRRLKTSKKKMERVEAYEQKVSKGETLLPEQVQTLQGKEVLLATIRELEKCREALLQVAEEEEKEEMVSKPAPEPQVVEEAPRSPSPVRIDPYVSLNGILELFFAARFVSRNTHGGLQNRSVLLQELEGQISGADFDSLAFLTSMIDGTSNLFSSDGMKSSLLDSIQCSQKYLEASEEEFQLGVSFAHIGRIASLIIHSQVFEGAHPDPELKHEAEEEVELIPPAEEVAIEVEEQEVVPAEPEAEPEEPFTEQEQHHDLSAPPEEKVEVENGDEGEKKGKKQFRKKKVKDRKPKEDPTPRPKKERKPKAESSEGEWIEVQSKPRKKEESSRGRGGHGFRGGRGRGRGRGRGGFSEARRSGDEGLATSGDEFRHKPRDSGSKGPKRTGKPHAEPEEVA